MVVPFYLLPTPYASSSSFFLRPTSPKINNLAFDYRTQEGVWPQLHQAVIPSCLSPLLYELTSGPLPGLGWISGLSTGQGTTSQLIMFMALGIIQYFRVDKALFHMWPEFLQASPAQAHKWDCINRKNTHFMDFYPHLQTTGAPGPLNLPQLLLKFHRLSHMSIALKSQVLRSHVGAAPVHCLCHSALKIITGFS